MVTVYTPRGECEAPAANATYTATGDFSPPPGRPNGYEAVASLSSPGVALSALPVATRSMLVEVAGAAQWEGVSLVDSTGPVDVLALPFQRVCSLPDRVNPPVTVTADPGQTMGLIDAHHALVVGGSSEAPLASVIDLGTGAIAAATPTLVLPRNDASVTSYGKGALVAGGSDPMTGIPINSAEIYESPSGTGVGGFKTQEILPLVAARSRHGAVVLVGGETLLIGGTEDGTHALSTLEYVAPGVPSTTLNVQLQAPRNSPTVFRLPTGKIFVGGGFDDSGAPVRSVEWLDGDLGLLESNGALPAVELCPPTQVAPVYIFAPLESGAVLAVPAASTKKGACSNVLVIRPNYTVDMAPPLSPPPPAPTLLFAGAASSPVLVAGGTVRQWDPWKGDFSPPLNVGLMLSKPRVMLAADPGLALWVADDSFVHALRFATRNAYSTDGELLSTDPSDFAPDRLVGKNVSFANRKLELGSGASAFLTDATFADFSIDFTATGPVQLLLRDNDTGQVFYFGAAGTCFPLLSKSKPANLRVERKGATVSLVSNGRTTPCNGGNLGATERVAIGFLGPEAGSAFVDSVTVDRLAPAD
jgi:hypothetical protein